MNKKVFTSMLTLTILFLCGMYVFKIFFPQEFVMSVENEKIVAIGNYITNHKWANLLFGFTTGFIFDWLYFGAITKRLVPNIKLIIIMIVYGLSLNIYYNFASVDVIMKNAMIVVGVSSCYMILTPMFFTKDIRALSITYSVNAISQVLLLNIRELSSFVANMSALSSLIWGIDNYLWLLLCYIIFNYKNKEVQVNG